MLLASITDNTTMDEQKKYWDNYEIESNKLDNIDTINLDKYLFFAI